MDVLNFTSGVAACSFAVGLNSILLTQRTITWFGIAKATAAIALSCLLLTLLALETPRNSTVQHAPVSDTFMFAVVAGMIGLLLTNVVFLLALAFGRQQTRNSSLQNAIEITASVLPIYCFTSWLAQG